MGFGLPPPSESWDQSQRRCRDESRLPPLAVGSGGRTKTAVQELRFVTAAARGGSGGRRRKGSRGQDGAVDRLSGRTGTFKGLWATLRTALQGKGKD